MPHAEPAAVTTEPAAWAQLGRRWVSIFAPIATTLIVVGSGTYFGAPMYEVGDYAANALQIERAKEFRELLGNYSRFGFNHPGPAFFYVYAAGDVLFRDGLHVVAAPLNGYLLTGVLLQSAFLAAGLALLSLLSRNPVAFLGVAGVAALILFRAVGNPAFQIWPPYQVVLPFFTFLSAAVALAMGRRVALPVLVVSGGFLVHGHVAQPLFVLPIAVIAYVAFVCGSVRRGKASPRRFIVESAVAHAAAIALLIPFLAPVLVDAARGPDGNVAKILAYASAGHPMPGWDQAIFYVLRLIALHGGEIGNIDLSPADRVGFLTANAPVLLGWLVLLVVSVWYLLLGPGVLGRSRWRSDPPRRLVLVYGSTLVGATVLTLIWAKSQTGPLFGFNALFFTSVLYLAALLPAFAAAEIELGRRVRADWVLAGGVILIAALQPSPLRGVVTLGGGPGDDSATRLHLATHGLIADLERVPDAVFLDFDAADWHLALGVALALDRQGVVFLVPNAWGFMFGYDHEYPGSPLVVGDEPPAVWRLDEPRAGLGGQYMLGTEFAIVSGLDQ